MCSPPKTHPSQVIHSSNPSPRAVQSKASVTHYQSWFFPSARHYEQNSSPLVYTRKNEIKRKAKVECCRSFYERIREVKEPSPLALLAPRGFSLWIGRAPKMPSPWSFLALAWAKSDFGLALHEQKTVSLAFCYYGDVEFGWYSISSDEIERHILGNLLVAQRRKLGCAGTHDGV